MIRGRIIKGIGGLYFVDTENGIFECSVRGIFRKNKITPTVGDFAEIMVLDEKKQKGSIEKIYERRNILARPRAANVDCCIVTFAAASPNINFDLLDRFLVLSEEKKLDAVICINKYDLAERAVAEYIEKVYSPVYKVIFTSALNKQGISELKEYIDGKTSVIAGPSGVGKSSIINCVIPDGKLVTGEISRKIERGKHTTRQVELLCVSDRTYIADSPGFTSVSLEHIKPSDLQYYFKEFVPFLNMCRFNDCVHVNEPDCAVKERLGNEISKERYDRYKFLFNELISSLKKF